MPSSSSPLARFDKAAVRALQIDCKAALAAVAAKHGLVLTTKSYTYRTDECPVGLLFKIPVVASDGSTVPPEQVEWNKHAIRWGFKKEDFGRVFTSLTHGDYIVCGIKPKSRKYPILGRNTVTGKVFKFHYDTVQRGFKDERKPTLTDVTGTTRLLLDEDEGDEGDNSVAR